MAEIKIKGISIDFPYDPYDSQIKTMENIITSMMEGSTGMIESPTGTGKSLSIICAVLAYKEHLGKNSVPAPIPLEKVPTSFNNTVNNDENKMEIEENEKERLNDFQIIICSRTHKQLDQLVQQLNKTRYRPKMTLLASRTQYCILPKLQCVEDKDAACSKLLNASGCQYYSEFPTLLYHMERKIFNIEEMLREGKKCLGCPYYAAKKLAKNADVIFAPYNYILDKRITANSDIDLSSSVVILDEAHNIDDVCRSSGSIELTSKSIDIIVNELLKAVKDAANIGDKRDDFISLLGFFNKLILNAEKIKTFDKINKGTKSIVRKNKAIKTELIKIGITCECMNIIKKARSSIYSCYPAKLLINEGTWTVIETLEEIIRTILFSDCEVYSYIFNKMENDYQNSHTFSYNFLLLDAAYIFGPFVKQVKSLIILSGTLTPFVFFSSELGHKFAHQIVASHLITKKQILISCFKRGHLNKEFIGTYMKAQSFTYLDQVAKIIYDISLKVEKHGGTLVFVPSYSFLDNLYARIKLLNLENLFCEPKGGGINEFESVLKEYHSRITDHTPVVLLCVYRGKASEGVDFKDSSARAVICVGIPYPNFVEPQIELKKEYNDKHKHFKGRMWYETQAFRAVNQAAGRAIRHKEDWGIIIMLDSRYQDKRFSGQLSGWVNEFMTVYNDYNACLKDINTFLDDKK